MSYNTQEISAAAGQPVELYRFVLGQLVWTVTSGREAITYQVESYQPAVIRRSAVEQSPEFARNGIDLECARDFAVAQLFAAARPNGVVSLTVFRNHLGDSEYITWWKGRVASVAFMGSTAKIRCESIFTALKRPGLRAYYQTGCRHALFDPGCGVNNQAYKLAGTVASFSGLNVISSTFLSQASGWLTGGYLRVGGVPMYAPVVLDEAFDKADNEFTALAMNIFTNFGFQMIVATPLKSVMTLEPFIGGACFIDISDRRVSGVLLIEYDGDRQRLKLPEHAREEATVEAS